MGTKTEERWKLSSDCFAAKYINAQINNAARMHAEGESSSESRLILVHSADKVWYVH